MAKIEPLRLQFENMKAMLARIAEDDEAIGFVGCIMKKDGTMSEVTFNITRERMAFAAALLLRNCCDE